MSATTFLGATALAILTVTACLIVAFIREPAAMIATIAVLALAKPVGCWLERRLR